MYIMAKPLENNNSGWRGGTKRCLEDWMMGRQDVEGGDERTKV